MQKEKFAGLLVIGGNPKQLRWYNLWDKMVCLLSVTKTHSRQGKSQILLTTKNRALDTLNTHKAHCWVDCLLSNLEKLLKNKIHKITDLIQIWRHYPNNSECCFITTMLEWRVEQSSCKQLHFTPTVSTDGTPNWMTFWITHWLLIATAPSKTGHLYIFLLENLAD